MESQMNGIASFNILQQNLICESAFIENKKTKVTIGMKIQKYTFQGHKIQIGILRAISVIYLQILGLVLRI